MCQSNCNIEIKRFKHLNYTERLLIERWHNIDKRSNAEIAILLNKSERTIRREINRGKVKNLTSNLEEIWVYSADVAQQKYEYQKTGKGPNLKIGNDYKLVEYIEYCIKVLKYSPEIIVSIIERDKLSFKNSICARTIRNTIEKGGIIDVEPGKIIYQKEYKEKNKEKTVCNKVPAEKSIEFRPEAANNRSEYGHWEGDLVIGKREKGSVLLTFTERKKREEIIIKIPGKSAKYVVEAIDKLEKKYKGNFSKKFKTITFDNGPEFRDYKGIEKSCLHDGNRTNIYYAHPYRSGERGTNENANRLIRRFVPKGIDMDTVSSKLIKFVEKWINTLPRAMFGFKTALEMK